jgi:hypothetical protein
MKANESVLKRIEIVRQLSQVPVERLNEIESFVKFICSRVTLKYREKKKSLKLWPEYGKTKDLRRLKIWSPILLSCFSKFPIHCNLAY